MPHVEPEIPKTPAYWFLLLERARDDGRFADAERCLQELRRLGVIVQWRRPRIAKAVRS